MWNMDNKKILLVEDCRFTQMIVASILDEKYELIVVESVAAAKKAMNERTFVLVILDVKLPDGDGFQFCQELRGETRFSEIPLFFLTGKTDVEDRVLGLSIGADDYITKPFEPEEFGARVEARLRRKGPTHLQTQISSGGFHADLTTQRVSYAENGTATQELSLTRIEFKLMVYLLKNAGAVVPRQDLFNAIWGGGVHVSDHTIDTHISSLRRKIGFSAHTVRAVAGRGYCFSVNEERKNS